jgi:hypothetical protein
MSTTLNRAALLLCWLGWHGKDEDRVICTMSSGIKIIATHCARCGHCYAVLNPLTKAMIAAADCGSTSKGEHTE